MPETDSNPLLVSMQGIHKAFPGVQALVNVDFDLQYGEIHALMGGNGAGKSTLIKVLTGVEHPDSGQDFPGGQGNSCALPPACPVTGHQHGLSGNQPLPQPDGCREYPHRPRTAAPGQHRLEEIERPGQGNPAIAFWEWTSMSPGCSVHILWRSSKWWRLCGRSRSRRPKC